VDNCTAQQCFVSIATNVAGMWVDHHINYSGLVTNRLTMVKVPQSKQSDLTAKHCFTSVSKTISGICIWVVINYFVMVT
jgi:hypothetical protein